MSSIEIPQTAAINEYAIIVDRNDNVAVVKKSTFEGLEVVLPNGNSIQLLGSVPPGHRFATRDIPAGDFVLQFGQPIGTSLGIEKGEWITHDNMSNDVPIVRDLPEDIHNPVPDYFPPEQIGTFTGFRRNDG